VQCLIQRPGCAREGVPRCAARLGMGRSAGKQLHTPRFWLRGEGQRRLEGGAEFHSCHVAVRYWLGPQSECSNGAQSSASCRHGGNKGRNLWDQLGEQLNTGHTGFAAHNTARLSVCADLPCSVL